MASKGLFLLTRAAGTLTLTVQEEILNVREGRCVLKEALVTVGKGENAPLLRIIHWKAPHGEWKPLTNVMELDKLPAHVALELYGQRWSVERCFLTLKDTLDLNHLFNASPSAISGQVYATALVYDALRLAQAEIAQKVDVEPERLSPEKLFPRILENMVKLTWAEEGAEKYYWKVKAQNPEAPPPDLHLERLPAFKLSLQGITLEKRHGHRRKGRFCKGRRQFTSYSKIPGAKKYVRIQLSGYDFKKAWKRCLRLAGIPDFRFHDTRHISATNLLDNGTPERVVMTVAGWKTNKLSTYYHRAGKKSLALVNFAPGSGHLVDTFRADVGKTEALSSNFGEIRRKSA